jgi:branched-chain amino acid transport system permease protein
MFKTLLPWTPLLVVLAVYATLLALGLAAPGHWQLVAQIAFYCALAGALNIFMGMTGYVDFGYVAFVGVGTYGMAAAITYLPQAGSAVLLVGLIFALVAAAGLSLAVGAVALRLRGAYFAIATVGLSEGLRYLLEGARIFRGSQGLLYFTQMNQALTRPAALAVQTFWADAAVMAVALLAAIVTFVMLRGKIGFALTALREDEDAASVLGVNVTRTKIFAFVISAILAGLLGAAKGLKLPLIYPDTAFHVHYTIEAILIVVLGGAGTLSGPIVGAILYTMAKHYLGIYWPGFQLLLFAPLMIAVVVLFPAGIVGFLQRQVRGTAWEPYVI